jgi:hypothetical protein
MSNYCVAEDVQVLLGYPVSFGATTNPTLTQVNDIISDVTNEIDFTLKSIGVTTQPTDPTLLGRLSIACKFGVACQVGMSKFGNNASVNDSQPGYYCQKYQAIIDDIKTNADNYGAVTGDATIDVSNHVLDGTYTEAEFNSYFIDEDFVY